MKLRLWATPEELAAATAGLRPGSRCTLSLRVLSVSPPYNDRGSSALARVYIQADEATSSPTPPTTIASAAAATPAGPTTPALMPPPAAAAPPPAAPRKTSQQPSGIPLEVPKDGVGA